jgi:hypothetical protein
MNTALQSLQPPAAHRRTAHVAAIAFRGIWLYTRGHSIGVHLYAPGATGEFGELFEFEEAIDERGRPIAINLRKIRDAISNGET